MANGYSKDLRVRAVAMINSGESAREAARLLNLGASTTIRWMDRWTNTGSVDAAPNTGHCRSPLEAHKQWLFDLVAAEPDLTLQEIRARLVSAKRLTVGKSSIDRFFTRHKVSHKKSLHAPCRMACLRHDAGSPRCRCCANGTEGRASVSQGQSAASRLYR